MKLDLNDLMPEEASLVLSEKPGKTYTLKKITLATRIWLKQRFGEQIKGIFSNQSLPEISEIAYHLLRDKSDFPNLEAFQEAIVTQKDFVTLMQAMLKTIGISEPVVQKMVDQAQAEAEAEAQAQDQGNAPSLSQPTGAQSTT